MRGARDEGQASVELALVLPLVVLLLLAVVQVTTVARDQILLVHAARAGAREASVGSSPAAVRRAVVASAGPAGLDPGRIATETGSFGSDDDTVNVRLLYRSPTDAALIGTLLPDVFLRANAAMRREQKPEH